MSRARYCAFFSNLPSPEIFQSDSRHRQETTRRRLKRAGIRCPDSVRLTLLRPVASTASGVNRTPSFAENNLAGIRCCRVVHPPRSMRQLSESRNYVGSRVRGTDFEESDTGREGLAWANASYWNVAGEFGRSQSKCQVVDPMVARSLMHPSSCVCWHNIAWNRWRYCTD